MLLHCARRHKRIHGAPPLGPTGGVGGFRRRRLEDGSTNVQGLAPGRVHAAWEDVVQLAEGLQGRGRAGDDRSEGFFGEVGGGGDAIQPRVAFLGGDVRYGGRCAAKRQQQRRQQQQDIPGRRRRIRERHP